MLGFPLNIFSLKSGGFFHYFLGFLVCTELMVKCLPVLCQQMKCLVIKSILVCNSGAT